MVYMWTVPDQPPGFAGPRPDEELFLHIDHQFLKAKAAEGQVK